MQKRPRREERIDVRVSKTSKDLLVKLTEKLGLSQTSVIELAIRRLAELERITNDSDDKRQP